MNALAKRFLRMLALALLGLLPGAAGAQPVLAARVNGAGIGIELLERQFEELLGARRLNIARLGDPAKAKALKREALDRLVRIELLWQQAAREGLAASDEEVERALAQVRARFPSQEAFLRRIERSGFDEQGYRAHTKKLLSGERLAQRIVEREVSVSEQDMQDFYAANAQLFRRAEQVRVRHLLVAVPASASPAQRQEARRRIDALAARARAGESFEALARQHSDDATRQWGGELDPFARGVMGSTFENAAFGLQPGEISPVIETAAGLHLIRLEERNPAAAVAFEAARERILEYLRDSRGRDAVEREVERLRAAGEVELLTPL